MGFIASIWNTLEPILLGLQLLFGLRFTFHCKLTEKQFELDANNSFNEVEEYLKTFGVKDVFFGNREMYLRHLKSEITKKRDFYRFLEGELHYRIFKKGKLPAERRINEFLIKSFFFVNGYKSFLSYLLIKERILKFFKRKNSYFHYISITSWRTKSYEELIKEVITIKKINPQLFERYTMPKSIDLKKNKPAISKAIDNVLSNGRISEKSIFNLATSEKLVFIHKYGEGFSNVFNSQTTKKLNLNQLIEKLEKSKAKDANKKLQKFKKELSELNDDWLKVPIGYSLENYGFQKLFSKMEGVYVLPLSLIPNKYQVSIELFLQEQIIKNAEKYIKEAYQKGNEFVEEENLFLKYLILAHVIPVNQIKFISEKRDIEYSSPVLSRMLLTSYLSSETSQITSLYINDIVRNFDFTSLLKDNKTDNYIKQNFENIKQILWSNYAIDIFKPFGLTILNDQGIERIIELLTNIDSSIKKHFLRNRLTEIVEFYKKLNQELNEIKK